MAYKKVEKYQWTKDNIKLLTELWQSKNTQEIADELGVARSQVNYMAKQIRTEFPKLLPKKRAAGRIRALIREALK